MIIRHSRSLLYFDVIMRCHVISTRELACFKQLTSSFKLLLKETSYKNSSSLPPRDNTACLVITLLEQDISYSLPLKLTVNHRLLSPSPLPTKKNQYIYPSQLSLSNPNHRDQMFIILSNNCPSELAQTNEPRLNPLRIKFILPSIIKFCSWLTPCDFSKLMRLNYEFPIELLGLRLTDGVKFLTYARVRISIVGNFFPLFNIVSNN
jgi:hypothetical protein